MKIILLIALVCGLCFTPVQANEFYVKNYIVMESSSGQVLEGKKIHEVQSVASISKIMTAIIAIENDDLSREVKIGEEITKAYGSGVYIHQNDVITIQDLLYGLLLRSGNDAALCLAYHVGGENLDHFITMMNQKAEELGMKDTKFHNPCGLDEEDEGNLSSVYDMALLMRYCMQNETFRNITKTKVYQRLDGNGSWHNKNKLLTQYPYAIGGKTGFTKKAKRTLVTCAKKEQVELIVVTFNCGDDFNFHENLYETYFNLYDNILCIDQGIYNIGPYQCCITQPLYHQDFYDDISYKVNFDDLSLEVYQAGQLLQSYSLIHKGFIWRYFFKELL